MGLFKRLLKRSVREANTYTFIAESPWLKNDFIGEKKNMEFDFEKFDHEYIHCVNSDESHNLMDNINAFGLFSNFPILYYGFDADDHPAGYFYINGDVIHQRIEVMYLNPAPYYIRTHALEWSDFMKNKKFTKADLKNGDVVKLSDGDVAIYIENFDGFIAKDGYYKGECFTDDLKNRSSVGHDINIMQVRRPNRIGDCGFYVYSRGCNFGTLVYDRERDDPDIEEMTMEDVCKALGKRVKIVDRK